MKLKIIISKFQSHAKTDHDWNYLLTPKINLLDIFEKNLPKLNTSYLEIYFLGDFNINLFENGNMILINPPVITKT